jgi:hypothetical protein
MRIPATGRPLGHVDFDRARRRFLWDSGEKDERSDDEQHDNYQHNQSRHDDPLEMTWQGGFCRAGKPLYSP